MATQRGQRGKQHGSKAYDRRRRLRVGGGNGQQDGKGQMVRITSIQRYATEDGEKCGLVRLSMGL